MEDITADAHAPARAAGIVDLEALERVRDKLRAVAKAEQAPWRAVTERNQAPRDAAAGNPLTRAAALARELGVSPSVATTALAGRASLQLIGRR